MINSWATRWVTGILKTFAFYCTRFGSRIAISLEHGRLQLLNKAKDLVGTLLEF